MRRGVLAGLAAAALATVAIAPPAAAAKAKPPKVTEQARFKLSLHGEQTSTSRLDEAGEGRNGPYSCHGEDSEHVSFATPRPVRVTVKAVRIEAGVDVVDTEFLWSAFGPGGLWGLGDPALKVQANVERRSAWTGTENCFEEREEDNPFANCAGSAQGVDWWLQLGWGSDRLGRVTRNRISLWDDFTRDQLDPLPDCPGGFFAFPDMALTIPLDRGSDVNPKVSLRKLFNRRVKRITIPASGERILLSEEGVEEGVSFSEEAISSISYTVSLTRIGRR